MKITLVTATIGAAFLLGACDNATKVVETTKPTNSNVGVVTNTKTTTDATNTATKTETTSNTNKALTREDFDKEKDSYAKKAKDSGASIGTGVNDTWLWTKIRTSTLTSSDLTDTTKVDVEVNNEVVTLKGSVPNASDKTKLVALVKGIEGVKSVKDNLQIVATTATSNTNSTANANKAIVKEKK